MMLMGLRIRRARLQAGMTQGELAGKVGVHRSAVTQWEREGGTRPSVEHLALISVATGLSFEWIATGRGDATHSPEAGVPAGGDGLRRGRSGSAASGSRAPFAATKALDVLLVAGDVVELITPCPAITLPDAMGKAGHA